MSMNSFGVSLLLFERNIDNFPVWEHGNVPQNRPFSIARTRPDDGIGGSQIQSKKSI